MTEWLDLDDAIALIRDARKIGEGAAIQFLIDACANGVLARQRPCYVKKEKDDWHPTIPAAVWRGAHLELGTGELYPAGTDPITNAATEFGGYGEGGNGLIEIHEADLREYLRKPAPKKRGRKPKVDGKVRQQILKLLNELGAPTPGHPKWASRADIERAILERADVSESTARKHAASFLAEWKAGKAGKGR